MSITLENVLVRSLKYFLIGKLDIIDIIKVQRNVFQTSEVTQKQS